MADVICMGDSLTYGYPFGPQDSWVELVSRATGLVLINRGINGDTTAGMLARFAREVVQKGPGVVVIMGGTNDAWFGVATAGVRKNMEAMVAQALEAKVKPVVVLPAPLYRETNDIGLEVLARRLEEYRVSFRDLAQKRNLDLLDLYTPLTDAHTGWGKAEYFHDAAHPSLEGYRELGRAATVFFKNLNRQG